jgi:hypothetical protein
MESGFSGGQGFEKLFERSATAPAGIQLKYPCHARPGQLTPGDAMKPPEYNNQQPPVLISVSPGKIASRLIFVVMTIVVVSILADTFDIPGNVERVLSVGREQSIPTWYASVTLLICAVLLALIAWFKQQQQDQFTRHWGILALLFLFFSIDEVATIHEMTTIPIREAFNTTGLLYFAWVIPGAALAILVALTYYKFLQHLSRPMRLLFIASGAVYVGGAVGVESISAAFFEAYRAGSISNLAFERLTDIEEMLEMAGVLLFIYTLLLYMKNVFNRIEIRVEDVIDAF